MVLSDVPGGATAVGVPARRLVLGKHSGRNALRARLEELGYITTAEELEQCYRAAMVRADVAAGSSRVATWVAAS